MSIEYKECETVREIKGKAFGVIQALFTAAVNAKNSRFVDKFYAIK